MPGHAQKLWGSASLYIGYATHSVSRDVLYQYCPVSKKKYCPVYPYMLMELIDCQVCNFLVGLYFLELVKLFGVGAVYAGFGGVSLLSALFAYNFIVETKGRSLEEIELSLSPAAPGERK